MKKILFLSIILVLFGACDKREIGERTTTLRINEKEIRYVIEGNFENESAYVIFTNSNALDRRFKERIVIRNNSVVSNLYMNSENEIKLDKIIDPLRIREKEIEALENLKNIKYINSSLSRNQSAQLETIESVGDKKIFNISIIDSNLNGIGEKKEFQLIKQVDLREESEKRALNIWLEGGKTLTPTQSALIADSFLKSGSNNDIYEYVTNIYGKEWYEVGQKVRDGLINPRGTIDILLYSMNESLDNPKGRVLGFYQGLDNMKIPKADSSNYLDYKDSNERVMFYMDLDSFLYNYKDTISTLAHEFVHTIVFYQKMVLQNIAMEIWLNEMLAMIGEDLVASKLNLPGPRGIRDITSNIPSVSEKTERAGRFYIYNSGETNSYEINEKISFGMRNYSTTFAYGAYLMRNIPTDNGNLNFIEDIIKNTYGGHEAIEFAFRKSGKFLTFEESIKNFARASLLSDNKFTGQEPYKYNIGKTFVHNGLSYEIGPINVHNYTLPSGSGFVYYNTNYEYAPILRGASIQYFKLGENLLGNKTFEIKVPLGIDYEIVVKNNDNSYDFDKSQILQASIKEIK